MDVNVSINLTYAQSYLYQSLNRTATQGSCLSRYVGSRFYALPIVIIDTAIEFIKIPARIIESIAFVFINLIGALFLLKGCSLFTACQYLEGAATHLWVAPVSAIFIVPKFAYKVIASLCAPAEVKSICGLVL